MADTLDLRTCVSIKCGQNDVLESSKRDDNDSTSTLVSEPSESVEVRTSIREVASAQISNTKDLVTDGRNET